jgi:ribonuclease PH
MARHDGRGSADLRPIVITPGYLKNAEGSALIECGDTRVLCTASSEDRRPGFLLGTSSGWVTAEYALLPGATRPRSPREASQGRLSGRTHEIQRLIGRCLRMAVDLERLGERTLWLDCDVLQADGGTRTAAITGAWVALSLALRRMVEDGRLSADPVIRQVAAVSVGVVAGEPVLDLDYQEDSGAAVDMNVVMDDRGGYIELQGTAEASPYSSDHLAKMLALAGDGIRRLMEAQRRALG